MQSPDSTSNNCSRYILQVYVGALSLHYEALSVEASKQTTAEEIVSCIVERLSLTGNNYELAEVAGECKERRLSPDEKPVSVMLLWPLHSEEDFHRFYLRESQNDVPWLESYGLDPQILRDFIPFLLQPENREYPDLCQLPDLNESTLLENLRQRFEAGHIYTYVGSILIAVNPFKFHPIYNPKYVRLYQNQRVGPILPPHIFAIADNAYYCMLKEKRNQCVVISGESGSGKTESTNFLLHHLTALSQKGLHGSGVEQTILSAGPVLEAFGNAKTAHNNNSSRFGKFIQVNYRENGMVQGAVVQKYLLEKSRIVSQGPFERNYHVFYYLLFGATEQEREILHLLSADKYCYINGKNLTLENCDEIYEFSRLKQSMEMVGFSAEKQRRLFNVLSAVLLLGNVEFFPKKSTYHHDESVQVRNIDVVGIISTLLKVKQDTLLAALTSKRVKASGETLIMQYKLPEAIAARDALAKCLYGSLFDWIVMQVNHALLNKDQTPHTGHSIGVLDIFGFEDFGSQNSFEQLCINYANEHLQYYFNLHVFKYEQNEYKKEGIKWRDIEFLDNSGCLQLFESKPTGLLCILDDLCNFPGATNETLLQKFNSVHKDNIFYEKPQKKENAFIIQHYAGKVKYQVTEMREKNLDLMRQDIVGVLKNSSMAFVRELVGADPVAVFRWAIIRAFFRGYFAFRNAGNKHRKERNDQALTKLPGKTTKFRQQNDLLLSKKYNSSFNDFTTMSTTALIQQQQQSQNPQQQSQQQNNNNNNKNPRKSWSSIAYSNKNFPDGKLGYESQIINNTSNTSGINNNNNNNNTNNNKNNTNNNSNNNENNNKNKYFTKGYSKFENSGQDVMARASQIVQKNKSFRPRERSKKGLKNLQSVKMTAGQNLSNQSTVKTRKQPLTVTAQFQNSLGALMDTLNQANPFFIRCIKSNPHKHPNKFDDPTVIRQLRYTGMLETVRIRRAGYNVRLNYDEFIQLYRILLPKGLVSSQKDVRDFMNTMDLNKQHYQLGVSKIYMRESQKMRLDIKLHTKIIDSIIMIQRWFRSILLRRKYLSQRTAAITIQSYWRMCLAQKYVAFMRAQSSAVVLIQATWRMYATKKFYNRLRNGIIIVQSHIRGKLARIRFKQALREKLLKERHKLRPTQSLPPNERSIDVSTSSSLSFDENCKQRALIRPHYSLDSELENQLMNTNINTNTNTNNNNSNTATINYGNYQNRSTELFNDNYNLILDNQKRDVLNKAENQFRRLMISANNNNNNVNNNNNNNNNYSYNSNNNEVFLPNVQQQQQQQVEQQHDYQNVMFSTGKNDLSFKRIQSEETTDSRSYDIERTSSKSSYYDDTEAVRRYESLKPPIRRVDSEPTGSQLDVLYDNSTSYNNIFPRQNIGDGQTSASGTIGSVIGGVGGPIDPSIGNLSRNLPSTHHHLQMGSSSPSTTATTANKGGIRRDLVCRSMGNDLQSINYPLSVITQQQQQQQQQHYQMQQMSQTDLPSPYNSNQSLTSPYKQGFIQQPTSMIGQQPLGKAAAFLGTLPEDIQQIKSHDSQQQSQHHHHHQQQQLQQQQQQQQPPHHHHHHHHQQQQQHHNITKPRRGIKTNLSDEYLGGTINTQYNQSSQYHPQQQQQQLNVNNQNYQQQKSQSQQIQSQKQSQSQQQPQQQQQQQHLSQQYPPSKPVQLTSIDSLRRRNSDPTATNNKIPLLEVNRGNDMYQSSTHINIAGHRFRKAARIGKAEKCASCQESDAFVNEGHRCFDCKVLVHTKCIQNGGVKTLQCEAKLSKRLRKNIDKISTSGQTTQTTTSAAAAITPSSLIPGTSTISGLHSKYSGTREYTDSTDKIIRDAKELQLMQDFITQKIWRMEHDCVKPSEVDRVFKEALREFKDNLVTQYSVAHKQNSDTLNIKYRDLISNFEQVMETCCDRKNDFPLTMGVNAFRGFMNEFMNSRETEKPNKTKRKKDKKRKIEEHTNYNGHAFQLTIINIPTACELCQVFLLWPIERGLVCQSCRLTCHKKCYQKSSTCNKISNSTNNGNNNFGQHNTNNNNNNNNNNNDNNPFSTSTLFGIPLTTLSMAPEGCIKIPIRIEQLITKIEMHGLYAEGIYRKSGVNSKIKELKSKMSELTVELDYDSYNVHVLANVLKLFLREMPEPLLSFDRYDDFLRASELSETTDRVSTLMSLIKKLPPAHHTLLERLVFHLALVAQREQYNRMSASSLAIVFAPCVLRTNRLIPAQDSLKDISRQTKCIETLITQKMANVKSTLADIDTLDTAAQTATTRLSTLRSSKVFTNEEFTSSASAQSQSDNNRCRQQSVENDNEEMILEDHIQEIRKEKAMLTSTLPSLARASSDDDLLSTDMDGEGGSLDDLSSSRPNCQTSGVNCGGSGGGGGSGSAGIGNTNDREFTYDNRDLKDSIDSSIGSDTISRKTIDSDTSLAAAAAAVGGGNHQSQSLLNNKDQSNNFYSNDIEMQETVNYNIRDQNIDYPMVTTQTTTTTTPISSSSSAATITPRGHKYLMDRDPMLKNSYTTNKSGNGSSNNGNNINNNNSIAASTKRAGSHQNLTYSMIGGPTNLNTTNANILSSSTSIGGVIGNVIGSSSTSVSGYMTGSTELQRQKPLAVRSMSGGYESSTSIIQTIKPSVTLSGGQLNLNDNPITIIGGGLINNNNNNNPINNKDNTIRKTSNNNNNNNNSSNNSDNNNNNRQNSPDDEPIMV